MSSILLFLCVSVGINLVMFVPAYLVGTDKLTDISYSLTFLFVAAAAYYKSSHTTAQLVLLIAISLWAIRLGAFLLGRVLANGKDKRFDDMRGSVLKFGRFWLLQGLTVFVVLLSSLLFWNSKETHLGLVSAVGLIVFTAGLLLEAIADQQKRKFSQNLANKGKWIATGVWGRSRHPNYLGEILVWSGLYVCVLPGLGSTNKLTALISPLYIIVLLLFVSGIPLLEKAADKKWGNDKNYQAYKKRVPVLVPRKIF